MKKLIGILALFAVTVAGCKKEKQDVLATVSTSAATNITSTTAKTGGNISNTGGTSLTKAGVVYAIHANPTVADSIVSNGGGSGGFGVTLTGLNANTVYYVRAFAINGTGTAYGNQVTFTTSAGLATVTTTPVGAISASAATAPSGGTIVNTGGAAITASGVCWSTKPHPTVANNETNDQVTNNSFTSTLSLLAANTVYYYRAYATNSYGTAYGNELSFNAGSTATVTDVDGNVYHTVTINGQTWMAENLRVTRYQNGDALVNAFTNTNYDWVNGTNGGGYTFANGDTTNLHTYGLLYSEYAVNDSRNLAPAGWHVATQTDWDNLEVSEGMPVADTAVYATPEGTIGPLLLAGGSSGLNLQLAGRWHYTAFDNFGIRAYYWTSTPANAAYTWFRLVYGSTDASYPAVQRSYTNGVGLSVRCVKNP